jgi:uncharacterized membrane protein
VISAGASGDVLPSRDDPAIAASSEGIGGVAGRRVRPGSGWWTPLRVLLAFAVLACTFCYLSRDWCYDRAWPRQPPGLEYTHVCYSDIPHLYIERGLAGGAVPYLDDHATPVEYPVLTGGLMWVTAQVARSIGGDLDDQVRRYFDVNVVILTICALAAVAATVAVAGRRPWDVAVFAAAPGLALTGFINWDLFAVALTAFGLLAWARERPVLAGVLVGLGAAAKMYPLFLLGPLFLLCARAGRLREFSQTLGAAAAAWLAVNLPVWLADRDGWAAFYRMNKERGADFGSLWYAMDQTGRTWVGGATDALSIGTFTVCCLGIGVLTVVAPRLPRLPQLAFLVIAAFLLTNKVYSPQYVLWLLPLAALARPRWRDIAIWQAGEVLHYLTVWFYLAAFSDADRGMPDDVYWTAITVRVACTVYLAAMVVRDVLRPEFDPVRASGEDDPAGGVLLRPRPVDSRGEVTAGAGA